PSITFEDVGGMEAVKKEIELKIIHPLQHPELYKAYGKKIGGGILLYGPPGCGKTYLAKATAGQVNAKFISVSLNDILDMWVGNSEKNLHEVFELARKNTPCVLFFDEIDALGASRNDMKQSSGKHLINQFLQELDGLENDNEGILIIGATNAPWHLDTAFRRPGRFDRIVFVPPPDADARASIFELKLKGKPTDHIDYMSLAKKTKDFSGADIEAVIDISVEKKIEESMKDGIPKPLTTKDLNSASKRHKASTAEWFATAKNFALYANESGLYDDILTFMKIKK
ncbi:MAG: ATP-binding protein, partial [Flammeovirgaceae bacterium]